MTSDDAPRNEPPIVRQLTREEKRDAIRRLIELHPHWSSRQVGRTLGCSHVTVERVRASMEGRQMTFC